MMFWMAKGRPRVDPDAQITNEAGIASGSPRPFFECLRQEFLRSLESVQGLPLSLRNDERRKMNGHFWRQTSGTVSDLRLDQRCSPV